MFLTQGAPPQLRGALLSNLGICPLVTLKESPPSGLPTASASTKGHIRMIAHQFIVFRSIFQVAAKKVVA